MPPPRDPVTLRTLAPAKVNWTIEVLGRRPDGYHEIRSVMQTISLADGLELRPAGSNALTIDGVGADALSTHDNLVLRAVRSFPQRCAESPVAFRLSKQIPATAGLGGGSSDAAAALRLLRRYWQLDASTDLTAVAAALGSDVPFFLRGGVQLVEGRGEILSPLSNGDPVPLILATPPIALPDKTARLYAQLRPEHYSNGATTERLIEKLRTGQAPSRDDYVNVFDRVADQVFPNLDEYRHLFRRTTGLDPCLAGAGPSLFGVCEAAIDHRAADDVIAAPVRHGFRAWLVHAIGPGAATNIEEEPRAAKFAP